METSKGMVSDSKRMSVHDGPGIRTTLFLKGCPLRCLWCHNPENLQTKPALSFTRKLCIGCGACARVCPGGLHSFPGKEHHIRFDACSGCGACTEECLPGALRPGDGAKGGGPPPSGGQRLLRPLRRRRHLFRRRTPSAARVPRRSHEAAEKRKDTCCRRYLRGCTLVRFFTSAPLHGSVSI